MIKNAIIVAIAAAAAAYFVPEAIVASESGPRLKVWTRQVYLDPTATARANLLLIQSLDDEPVVLTDVSVNNNPKCFPGYKGAPLAGGLGLGILEILYQAQGITVMKDGYSKELSLGDVEKISLGSLTYGGCSVVKVVITTDRGIKTFMFD